MPTLVKSVTAAVDRVKTTITIPIEHQILKSLCVLDIEAANQPNDAYVSMGMMTGGTEHQHKTAILASGYVGSTAMVGWTGSIPIDKDTYAFADIYSSAGGEFRLVAIPWKIVGTKDGLFVVDP